MGPSENDLQINLIQNDAVTLLWSAAETPVVSELHE